MKRPVSKTVEATVCTIQLVLDESDPDRACDLVSAILSENTPDGVLGWQYTKDGLQWHYPSYALVSFDEKGHIT